MKNNTILIADDEKEITDILGKKIAAEGYTVIKAYDGQEAWEKIQSESPDVVIVDINMPRMDGLTVLKKVRENPPGGKWLPVIILSARREISDINEGFALEADQYLTKPCSTQDVLKAIRLMFSLIPQRKSRSEIDNQDKKS